MNATSRFLAILICAAGLAHAAEPPPTSAITVAIHDSHGLSAASAEAHHLEIILFKPHTHIHLKISNTTQQALLLWRPYCPEGDDAMCIEFREASAPDKVFSAHTGYSYTGGMGIPKVLALAPADDLLVNVDFLNEWVLPFSMQADEIREMEVRATYRSAPLTDERQKSLFGSKPKYLVWTGESVSDWKKVRIINRTGSKIAPKP
ncbi:hypothetical protein [Verrucomicrobium sp. BvORR034]|uniref:hypothetical protein n=1 Tax=Verrucomicrobium sp. BvORR034 TaxID=1396418 RepID=UPI000678A10A|nr:hypothetical protein [Verrucomicrobium sp. BvORR034]